MTTINSDLSTTSYSIDSVKGPALDVSDAAQMENNFIELMVAQIRNQDPTKPVDSTEFLNQYSAMSQVKSMENMTTLSKNNLVLMDNLQTLTASGLVGQSVNVEVDTLVLGDDRVSGQLQLEYGANTTELTLTDSNGISKRIQLGAHADGTVPFTIDPKELGLAPGKYSISAKSDAGETPAVEISGKVTRVRVSEQGPVLDVIGAGNVPFYKLTEFGQTA